MGWTVAANEKAKEVARTLPFCEGSDAGDGASSVAMKGFAEGHYTEEEYAPIKAQREALREEIRRLQK